MISKPSIKTIANLIALNQRDEVVNQIGDSLRNAFSGERISEVRIQRILDKFTEGLRKI